MKFFYDGKKMQPEILNINLKFITNNDIKNMSKKFSK